MAGKAKWKLLQFVGVLGCCAAAVLMAFPTTTTGPIVIGGTGFTAYVVGRILS